jgi:dienelactone hydrolase
MFAIMKRTIFLNGALLLFATCYAQDNTYKVIPGNTDTLQYNYFMERLQTQFDHRREQVERASRSENSLLERRDALRERFREMIGELPARCPLNPKVSRKMDMDSYTVEAVVFESLPNHHVTGLFYLPKKRKAPYPAVYIPCGHTSNGKAGESYQKAARLFAMNGFAVLQADPVCQGERYQLLNEAGQPKTSGGTLMHEFFGQALALTGSSTLEHELYDNIRCIDFLEQHPAVDKERIAVAGNSGGGTQTTYLIAYDHRIKAATPSCYIATTEQKMRTHGIGDFCQHLWGEGANSMEEQDFLFMAAPAPVRILSATDDFFPLKGAKIAFKELSAQYAVLGIPEKIGHSVVEGPHGWPIPNREASVKWCRRWMMNDSSAVIEPADIGIFTDEECLASPTGQVLSSYENERSMFDIIRDRIADCRKNRESFLANSTQDEILGKIRELIGYEEPQKKTRAKKEGILNEKGYRLEKLLLERDKKEAFHLPALLLTPDGAKNESPAVILINEEGKSTAMGKAIKEVKKGHVVLVVDISDTGELEDKKQFLASGSQYFTAKFPLYEGKTLLGYRTEDIIIAARYLLYNHLAAKNELSLVSTGNTGYAALHAVVCSGYFNHLEIIGEVKSWETVAAKPYLSQQQLSRMDNLVPDALNFYDIPDLISICIEKNINVVQREE